jgi:hypothetical protein
MERLAKRAVAKARRGKMSAQAPTELTRENALALLLRIATDRKSDMSDRLEAIRVHSRMCGYILTEGQIRRVITTLANDGTFSVRGVA